MTLQPIPLEEPVIVVTLAGDTAMFEAGRPTNFPTRYASVVEVIAAQLASGQRQGIAQQPVRRGRRG